MEVMPCSRLRESKHTGSVSVHLVQHSDDTSQFPKLRVSDYSRMFVCLITQFIKILVFARRFLLVPRYCVSFFFFVYSVEWLRNL